MLSTRCLSRATVRSSRAPQLYSNISTKSRTQVHAATHPYARRRHQHFVRSVAATTILAAGATTLHYFYGSRDVHAEEPPQKVEPRFEEKLRHALSPEDNRDLLSSQHLQVKESWKHPGVYLWGSNSGKVAAPDSNEKYIKTPRRLPFFDDVLLRDIKLDRNFAAAIDEKGDLLQWGTAFSPAAKGPVHTLKGKNLVSCALSRDRVIALSSNGTVYSLPVSQKEQQEGPKPTTSSWVPFLSSSDTISYRIRTPSSLGLTEKVTQIASGQEHALLLTSAGRVFALASGTQDFPKRGELGIPGLTWATRPSGPFDVPHEITSLSGLGIKKIAVGDHHSLAADATGRVFTWGDNTSGQLGFDFDPSLPHVDTPTLLPTNSKFYAAQGMRAAVTDVYAGGNSSFLSVEATKSNASPRDPRRIVEDTWAFGYGLTGQLGTGKWRHTQDEPVRVPALSGLNEFSETWNAVIPIKMAYMSIGATHAAAVLDNEASVDVSSSPSPSTPSATTTPSPTSAPLSSSSKNTLTANDTNWGRDILFWGNNEFYQIGSGKRNNVATPSYIQPLDHAAEVQRTAASLGIDKQAAEKQWHRFQITPKKKIQVGRRNVEVEQRVECGRGVTGVYSAV